MIRQYARAIATFALFAPALGCSVDLTGLGNEMEKAGWCNRSTTCNEVSMSGPALLLLGDTAAFLASTKGGDTDLQWEHSTAAVSFVGSPLAFNILGEFSHAVVLGAAVGLSAISASRKGYSASVSVEIIPPTALGRITIDRVRCTGTGIGFCDHTSQSALTFRDTLMVGDSVRVDGSVKDLINRTVTATIKWSTSDPSVAAMAYTSGWPLFAQIPVVVGVAPGNAVVTGTVGGLQSSFTLHVVKGQ